MNSPSEGEYRKDYLYESLTKIRYSDDALFRRLSTVASALNRKFPEDPSSVAFSAYCDALALDWRSASEKMRKVIRLESGKNLDSWIDLGHFLRKLPECAEESRSILLDPVSKVRT